MFARKVQNGLNVLLQHRTGKLGLLLVAGAGIAAIAAAAPSQARADGFSVALGFNFGTPIFVAPAPVVYTPAPMIVTPAQPVYAPAPLPYAPPAAPVAYTPEPVYTPAPAYAPPQADYYAQPVIADPTPVVSYGPAFNIVGAIGQSFGWGGDNHNDFHRDGNWQQDNRNWQGGDRGGRQQDNRYQQPAHFEQRPMPIQPRFDRQPVRNAHFDRAPQHFDHGGRPGFHGR